MNDFFIVLGIMAIIFGTGFYTGVSICRKDTFKNAKVFQIIKGILFGIFLWPVAMVFLLLPNKKFKYNFE